MKNTYQYYLYMLIGALVLFGISVVPFFIGFPTQWFPWPIITLIPAFLGMSIFAAAIPPILFCLFSFHLFQGVSINLFRTHILFIIILAINIVIISISWNYGIIYQGKEYLEFIIMANIIAALFILGIGIYAIFHKRYWTMFIYHFSVFVWLAWFSLPSLGELP